MTSIAEASSESEGVMLPIQRTVVLAEDDAPLRAVLADEIRDLGFDVVELADGLELLAYFRSATAYHSMLPNVVVAEADLPGCNGVEACSRLQQSGPHVPFILISPSRVSALHDAALEAGADRVLDRPLAAEALANAVVSVTHH